jgi:hypothetical protein
MRARANSGQLNAERWGFSASKLGKAESYVYYAPFAAKMLLDMFLDGDEPEWVGENELVTSRDVRIHGQKLREIYEYKIKAKEEKYFSIDEDTVARVANVSSDKAARPFTTGETTTRQRNSRKGMVLIKTVCEELDMLPRTARSILRKARYKKPKKGWAWDHNDPELQKVKALLQGKSANTITVDFSKAEDPDDR